MGEARREEWLEVGLTRPTPARSQAATPPPPSIPSPFPAIRIRYAFHFFASISMRRKGEEGGKEVDVGGRSIWRTDFKGTARTCTWRDAQGALWDGRRTPFMSSETERLSPSRPAQSNPVHNGDYDVARCQLLNSCAHEPKYSIVPFV